MSAAHGIVSTHDSKIPLTTRMFAWRVAIPMSKSDPTETCVVETGKPIRLAKITKMLVERFAANP